MEVLGYYYTVEENGEEVIHEVTNNDQIFHIGRQVGDSVEIVDEIPYNNTGECNSEVVLRANKQGVEDQVLNMTLSPKHRITPENKPQSKESEENRAHCSTSVQFISEDYVNKKGKNNPKRVKEGLRIPEPEIERDSQYLLDEDDLQELSEIPQRGRFSNQGESDSISGEIFRQNDELDLSCEKEAFKNKLVQALVERYLNESVDTDENADEGQMEVYFVAKINEYLENLVNSEDEGIYKMFARESAETNQAIKDIPQSSEENYLYKNNEEEIFVMSKKGCVDDTEDTISENKGAIYQINTEENDYITNEVGINESEQDICLITEKTNEKVAEVNLQQNISFQKRNDEEIAKMDWSDFVDNNEGTFTTDEMEICEKSVEENYVTVGDTTNELGINESSEQDIYLITANESTVTADKVEKYQTSTEENDNKMDYTINEVAVNKSSVKMDMSGFLDDNKDEMGENIISKVGGDNEVDDTTNKVGKTQTSGFEMDCLWDGIGINKNAAEEDLPVIIQKRGRKEKMYAILNKEAWKVAYLSMHDDIIRITETQTNIVTDTKKTGSAQNLSLFQTVSKKINGEAVPQNVDTIKNVYMTRKDGNILYKVTEEDVEMCGMKSNEEDSVQLGEMSISKILCAEINKKTGIKRFKELIVARKDGYEKVYDILDSKNKVNLVQLKSSKKKTKRNKKTKKNKKKTEMNKKKTKKKNKRKTKKKVNRITKKIKKHKKESTKKIAHRMLKENLQMSETCENEAKDEGTKEKLPTVLGIMKIKENNARDKEKLVKKVRFSKKQEKISACKANKKVKINKNKKSKKKVWTMIFKKLFGKDPNKIKRKCKCSKPLPSYEEKFGIDNLVDYFVEEQISDVCFYSHRAAKFKYSHTHEDIPNDDEYYALPDENHKGGVVSKIQRKKPANKIPCSWCQPNHLAYKVGYLKHLAKYTGESVVGSRGKNPVIYNPGSHQPIEKRKGKIVLTPREPTCSITIKKLSVAQQVLRDLENKGILPKPKIPVDVIKEKASTVQNLSNKKDTLKRKRNHKKIACSLLEKSKGQVEKNKGESKKKMQGSNQGKVSFSPLKKKRKVQEDDEVISSFEEYQRCLKEDDEIVKKKIEKLQIKIDQAFNTCTHLLEEKERTEKEETTSGCFSENMEKAKEDHKESNKTGVEGIQKNKEIEATVSENNKKTEEEQLNNKSNKTDVEGITKNKEINKTLLENIEKRERKKESKKRRREEKSPEKNEKVTMEWENKVFLRKSKKRKVKETKNLLLIIKKMIAPDLKKKLKSMIASQQEALLRKRESKNTIDKQSKWNNKSRQKKKSKKSKKNKKQSKEENKKGSVKRSREDSKEKIECSKNRIEEYSSVDDSSKIKSVGRKRKDQNKKLKTKAKRNSVSYPLSLNNEHKELFEIATHVDYNIETPSEATVVGSKKKIKTVKKQSYSKSQDPKKRKANTSIELETALLNKKACMELGLGTDRQMRLKNQKIENSKVKTESNSLKPTKKSTKKMEEGKSNTLVLDGTEEIFPNNKPQKREYDFAFEDGSEERDYFGFKLDEGSDENEGSGENYEDSDSKDSDYTPIHIPTSR